MATVAPTPKLTTNTIDHITLMRVFDKSNKELRYPVSAWSDLGNINEVKVIPQKEGGCKTSFGGDGGVGYEAVLYFSHGVLTSARSATGSAMEQQGCLRKYCLPVE